MAQASAKMRYDCDDMGHSRCYRPFSMRPAVLPLETCALLTLSSGDAAGLQRRENAVPYIFHCTFAGELEVPRRTRLAGRGKVRVVIDERFGLRVIVLDAFGYGLLAVIRALHERFTRDIVLASHFRWIEVDVVCASRAGMHAATAHAAQ